MSRHCRVDLTYPSRLGNDEFISYTLFTSLAGFQSFRVNRLKFKWRPVPILDMWSINLVFQEETQNTLCSHIPHYICPNSFSVTPLFPLLTRANVYSYDVESLSLRMMFAQVETFWTRTNSFSFAQNEYVFVHALHAQFTSFFLLLSLRCKRP